MFPLPISFYIYAGLSLLAIAGLGYGRYEHNALSDYKTEIAVIAEKQKMINESVVKQQDLVSKASKENYEAKLSALKSYYGGLHNSSSGSMPTLSNPSSTANGSTSDQLLACAYTTQQLVSLQEWINQQIEIK